MNYTYDVRGIRFTKDRPQETHTMFYCLGHFSYIEVRKLNQSDSKMLSPLQMIEDDLSEQSGVPAYPLYLLKRLPSDNETAKKAVDSFWENTYKYTSLVRLHCTWPGERSLLTEFLENALKSTKNQEITVTQNGILQVDMGCPKSETVAYLFYDSLELGDAVTVLRADSLAAIMHTIEMLHTLSSVQTTYTYHGISTDTLKDVNSCRTHKIYASTRFSFSKTSQNILNNNRKIFEKLTKSAAQAFVTGATDYLIDWGKISERNLIHFFSEIMFNYPDLESILQDAITRIGLPKKSIADIAFCSNNATPNSNHQKQTNNYDTYLENIQKNLFDKRFSCTDSYTKIWFASLSNLVESFAKMEQNPVTDDLSRLLLPGLEALLSQIDTRLNKDHETWNPALDKGINSFVADCLALANNISNLESQLYQRPELAPTHSYIPATLLRFEQQFARLCCLAFVAKDDEERQRVYVPLVTTTQQRDIRTECPIEIVENDKQDICPLQIYLPTNTLYRPWTAAVALCHEAAHYSGIYFRQREARLDCLANCAAAYITSAWAMDLGYKKDVLTLSQFQKQLSIYEDKLAVELKNYAGQDKHLSKVLDALCQKIYEIYFSRKEFERFSDIYITHGPFSPQEKLDIINYCNNCRQLLSQKQIDGHFIYVIKHYCRECYADIAMLILLDCSMKDYYYGVFAQEFSRINIASWKNRPTLNYEIKRYIDRIAFVLDAMLETELWKKESINHLPKEAKWIFTRAEQQLTGKWNDTDNDDYYLLYQKEVQSLKAYFRICARSLKNERYKNNSYFNYMNHARRALKSVNDKSFDLAYIQEFSSRK